MTLIAHVDGVPIEKFVYLLAAAGGELAALTRLAWSGVRRHRPYRAGRRPQRQHRRYAATYLADTLARGGTDLVVLADLLGKGRLVTTCYYEPAAAAHLEALHLPVDH